MSLFKKKKPEENFDSISGDGTHAVSHFNVADAIMMIVIALLCCTCIFPFLHIIAKSFSSNAAVASQQVAFWPIDFNFEAYDSILDKDAGLDTGYMGEIGVFSHEVG